MILRARPPEHLTNEETTRRHSRLAGRHPKLAPRDETLKLLRKTGVGTAAHGPKLSPFGCGRPSTTSQPDGDGTVCASSNSSPPNWRQIDNTPIPLRAFLPRDPFGQRLILPTLIALPQELGHFILYLPTISPTQRPMTWFGGALHTADQTYHLLDDHDDGRESRLPSVIILLQSDHPWYADCN